MTEHRPSNQLLPCPRCASQECGFIFNHPAIGPSWVWIKCDSCGLRGNDHQFHHGDHQEAMAAARAWWNERPIHEPPAARKPDKFDLAFEIMRQLEAEDMETMQSCQFGYVMRVTREGASKPPTESHLAFLLFHVLDELSMYEDFTRNEVADHLRAELIRLGLQRPSLTKVRGSVDAQTLLDRKLGQSPEFPAR